jgi:hypothetical protein
LLRVPERFRQLRRLPGRFPQPNRLVKGDTLDDRHSGTPKGPQADPAGRGDDGDQMSLTPSSSRPGTHVPFRPAHLRVLGICAWLPVMERVIVTPSGWVIRTRIEWMGLN